MNDYCLITNLPLPPGHTIHPNATQKLKENLETIRSLHPHCKDATGGLTRPNPPSETHTTNPRSPINYEKIEDLHFFEQEITEIAEALTHTPTHNIIEATHTIQQNLNTLLTHPNASAYYHRINHVRRHMQQMLKHEPNTPYRQYQALYNTPMPANLAVALYNATNPREITPRTLTTMRERRLIPPHPHHTTIRDLVEARDQLKPRTPTRHLT